MGGGVMRTAAKAAATGAFRSRVIGESSRRVSQQQISSFAPALEPGHDVSIVSAGPARSETPAEIVAVQWPDWEFDEWEFTGAEEDTDLRLVFGPTPTVEEAKEAITDLKEALDKVYFTPQHAPCSHKGSQVTTSGESNAVSVAPKHVAQMFSLLRENAEVQEVVASLASDKNVWNAVMNNEKVMKFCKNPSLDAAPAQIYKESEESAEESKFDFSSTAESTKDSAEENKYFSSTAESTKDSAEENKSNFSSSAESTKDSAKENKSHFSSTAESTEDSKASFFEELLNNIKARISQAILNICDFVQGFFEKLPKWDSSHTSMFMALAVATILIIVLKRK